MIRNYILASMIMCGTIAHVTAETVSLARLNDTVIKIHARSIKKELWRNDWYKRLTIAAAVGTVAYGTYYFFLRTPSAQTAPVVPVTAPSQQDAAVVVPERPEVTLEEVKVLIQEQRIDRSTLQSISEFMLEQRRKANVGFTGTVKSWGATTLNFVIRESAVAVVFSAVIGVFGKYFKSIDNGIDAVAYKLFHPGNLQWYIASHTNVFTFLNELELYAGCIEHKRLPKKQMVDGTAVVHDVLLSDEEVAHYTQAFVTTWSLCAREFESILGFMLMKIHAQAGNDTLAITDKSDAESVQVAELLQAERYKQVAQHVHEMVHAFSAQAETIICKDGTSKAGLVHAVNRLRLMFMDERAAFTTCENL